MKKYLITLTLLFVCSTSLYSQNINLYQSSLSYSFAGGYAFPFGGFGERFNSGFLGGVSFYYMLPEYYLEKIPAWKYYYFESGLYYSNFKVDKSPESGMAIYSYDIGPNVYYPLHKWFVPFAGVTGGLHYSYMTLSATEKSAYNMNGLIKFKTGFFVPVTSSLSMRVEGLYSHHFMSGSPLKTYGMALSLSYNFSGDYGNRISKNDADIKIANRNFDDLFSIRYLQYNQNGIGNFTIKNTGDKDIYNVQIETEIEGFSDGKKSTESIDVLSAGDIKMINIPISVSTKVLENAEDRQVNLNCRIIYSSSNTKYNYHESYELKLHNKNAITWDDTKRIGSYIMPKDKTASGFARKAIASIDSSNVIIPKKIYTAMILFNAISAHNITYVSDPQNAYSVIYDEKKFIDYVQLPSETISKRGGDCDDLTVLYATLLESTGISTGIATIPGHIFVAFDTEIPESQYNLVSSDKKDVIIKNGTIWIPVEVTKTKDSFNAAWMEGLKNSRDADFELIETNLVWQNYPPSDISNETKYSFPEKSLINSLVSNDYNLYVEKSFTVREKNLKDFLDKSPKDFAKWNELGFLYAKNKMYKEAEESFNKSLEIKPDNDKALSNMGNIYYMRNDYSNAVDYYRKAISINPKIPNHRINYAIALYDMNEYAAAKEEYLKITADYPEYAQKYSYLSRGGDSMIIADRRSEITNNKEHLLGWEE